VTTTADRMYCAADWITFLPGVRTTDSCMLVDASSTHPIRSIQSATLV
jgi:hypothetical protein